MLSINVNVHLHAYLLITFFKTSIPITVFNPNVYRFFSLFLFSLLYIFVIFSPPSLVSLTLAATVTINKVISYIKQIQCFNEHFVSQYFKTLQKGVWSKWLHRKRPACGWVTFFSEGSFFTMWNMSTPNIHVSDKVLQKQCHSWRSELLHGNKSKKKKMIIIIKI